MKPSPIVEIEGELYIVLETLNNREDAGSMSYSRDLLIYPYSPDLPDDLHIQTGVYSARVYQLRGVTNTVIKREDKIPYEQYGYSVIEGIKTVMLRRKYPEEITRPSK